MTFWQYYGIGKGKVIPYSNLSYTFSYNVTSPFENNNANSDCSTPESTEKYHDKRKLCTLLFCPEQGCIKSFESDLQLEEHLLEGNHSYAKNLSSMDNVRLAYAEMIHASSSSKVLLSRKSQTSVISSDCMKDIFNAKEFALSKQKFHRFTFKQKHFVYKEFINGKTMGKKSNPEQLVSRMRTLRDEK